MSKSDSQFATIDATDLDRVQGGAGAWDSISSGASTAYNAVRNFGSGFAAGATYGPNGKTEQIERYGNRNDTGFKPGVETGMMFNMALGPVGRLMSTTDGAVPSGGGGGGGGM